jgi:hypothetical protein
MAGTIASLLIKLGLDATGVEQGVARAERSIGGLSAGAGTAMKVAGSLIGGGLAFAAKGALEMEDRAARFQAATGASAQEARRFSDWLNAAAGRSLVPMEQIAESAELVRVRFGETGEAGDALTESFLRWQRATGQGASSVADFEDTIKAWNLTAADTSVVMDKILASNQRFGGTLSANQDALTKLAPALQAANLTLDDGISLLNMANDAGVDASSMVTGLTKALGTIESPDELRALLTDIAATQDPFERATKAADVFGAKAGTKLAQILQRSGGDLSRYALEWDDAVGAVDRAAGAMDSTITSKLKLAVNQGLSIIRGFGMQVGPVLTGAVSAISFAKSLGLDRALAPLFKGAGARAGAVFSAALARAVAASRLLGPLASRLGDAASGLGRMAGGRFGMAFKAAAAVGLGLLIADQLAKLGEVRQANVEAAAEIDESMRRLLAEAPSRAEAEQKLAALKAIPENLEGIQGALYGFADFAKGNVLGSAIDGLFGANPAQVNQEQIRALETYLAQLPADTAATATAAGAQVTANVAAGARANAGAVRRAGNAVGSEAAQGVRDGIAASASKVAGAWDTVASALAKGPRIMSRAARLKEFGKAVDHATRMLRRSIVANDPLAASYWQDQLARVSAAQAEFRGTTTKTMGEVKADLAAAGVKVGGSFRRMARDARRQAGRLRSGVTGQLDATARRTQRAADRTAAALPDALSASVGDARAAAADVRSAVSDPLTSLNAYQWGSHAGGLFASGIASQEDEAQAAAASLARATRRMIAFSRPPRTGPLSTIRSWGPHMVQEWLGPMERKVGDVERMGSRLGAALTPHPGGPAWMDHRGPDRATWAAVGAVGGGGRGGEVHIHVGTLIANDSGLDELERRMERRRHLRRRDRRLVGSRS